MPGEEDNGALQRVLLVNHANTLKAKIHVSTPAVEALDSNTAAKVLCVGPAEGQAIAQAGNRAAAGASGCDSSETVAATAGAGEVVGVVGEGGEGVGPDVGRDIWGDASTAITDPDGDTGGVVVERG